ncbi:hypothetical protein F442_13341 [Phytophthora nicotianae P10297]|uniref:Uncharacterized protein n=1 Tax=Phytophthora nicotianae P10297 TaxID=1317064 RepID=W2YWU9_PHYNI|nr:hypothetical protein F442_13341 [Phytophthora nicotianae P10297]
MFGDLPTPDVERHMDASNIGLAVLDPGYTGSSTMPETLHQLLESLQFQSLATTSATKYSIRDVVNAIKAAAQAVGEDPNNYGYIFSSDFCLGPNKPVADRRKASVPEPWRRPEKEMRVQYGGKSF